MKRLILVLAVIILAQGGIAHGTVILDFESLAHDHPDGKIYVTSHSEDGFTVESTNAGHGFGIWSTSSTHFAGSTGMFNNDAAWTIVSRDDGGKFDLLSLGLSHMFNTTAGNSRMIITFEGTKSDSSSVTEKIDVPRHFGFQTYAFTGLTDLVSVRWDQSAFASVPHQFDAITLAPFPDPSNASFASMSDLNSLTIDFGILSQHAVMPTVSFDIWNYAQAGSADLELATIAGTGDTGTLTTNLQPFGGLNPGSSRGYTASMDTSICGDFAATYTLGFTDVTGEPQSSLVLNLTGTVVPEPSSIALWALLGFVITIGWWRRKGTS